MRHEKAADVDWSRGRRVLHLVSIPSHLPMLYISPAGNEVAESRSPVK
jgi:hypothetical protein